MNKNKLYYLVLSGILLAVLIICSQLTIPLPLVPLTLQTLAIGLIASLLPALYATEVVLAYLLLGIIGVPVFAQFSSGFSVILGYTGGYLITFVFYALITASILQKIGYSMISLFIANLIGASFQLFFGALWMVPVLHIDFKVAMTTGVIPFIIPAIIKICLVCVIAKTLRNVLIKKIA